MKRIRGLFTFGLGACGALALGWAGLPHLLYERVDQPMDFNHAVHGDGAGLTCEDCHGFDETGRFTGIPPVAKCAECHTDPMGDSETEAVLIRDYIEPNREIPWRGYVRQPDNVYFSHAPHVRLAGLTCERCHGDHGTTETLRPLELNRVSGYSRDIWGPTLTGLGREPWEGKKMDDCASCHREHGVVEGCLTCHK